MSFRIIQTFKADVYGSTVTSLSLYNAIGTLHCAMLENKHQQPRLKGRGLQKSS